MAAPIIRVDLSASSAVALCRLCPSWRGGVHTGSGRDVRAKADGEAHRANLHARADRNTRHQRGKRTRVFV